MPHPPLNFWLFGGENKFYVYRCKENLKLRFSNCIFLIASSKRHKILCRYNCENSLLSKKFLTLFLPYIRCAFHEDPFQTFLLSLEITVKDFLCPHIIVVEFLKMNCDFLKNE
jgi:hypothetical protein